MEITGAVVTLTVLVERVLVEASLGAAKNRKPKDKAAETAIIFLTILVLSSQ